MERFAADENVNIHIVSGLLDRNPTISIVRVQEAGLASVDDPVVLEWAASEGRILLTHDVSTMPGYASHRLDAGQPMSGLFLIPQGSSIRDVIEDLLLIAECSLDDEWEGRIEYLPL